MTTAAWLACGALLAGIAWFARPSRYPGGSGTALAAGLCGGFLGGAIVILIAGRDGALPALSVGAAAVGAIVMLDLAEVSSGRSEEPARRPKLDRFWSWACLLDPLLLAGTVGLVLGAAADSAPVGASAASVTLLLFYLHRNHGVAITAKWRRRRG